MAAGGLGIGIVLRGPAAKKGEKMHEH